MKKLFLILILSFFSSHSFAGSCPDGSDPVKSISADGTYFVYNCSGGNEKASSSTAKSLKFELDTENGKLEDYSYITDPTGNFNKVHKFTTGSECGSKTRDIDWDNMVGEMETSDCGENSVRSQMVEQVWEDNRPGDIQPKYQWYSWDVYLPEDFPIQDSGKLLLAEFHNGECAHISFTSQGGDDKGVLNFTTMKLWDGDCKDTSRIPITQIQDMRGKWTNFHLEMKWENNETGLANLWLNGKQVLAYKGRTLTLQKENLNFMLFGLYQCCNDRDKVIKPAMAYFTTPKTSMNPITPVEVTLDNKKTASSFKVKPKAVKPLEPIKKVGEAANSFDGAYAFIIRTEPDDGEKNIGTAQFIIKDGKISVARKYRYLLTSAISSYDTFEGVIDKEGNISASFELNPIRHMVEPKVIKFSGDIDSLQLRGRFDEIKSWDNNTKGYVLDDNFYPSFYDVIIDFKKENY